MLDTKQIKQKGEDLAESGDLLQTTLVDRSIQSPNEGFESQPVLQTILSDSQKEGGDDGEVQEQPSEHTEMPMSSVRPNTNVNDTEDGPEKDDEKFKDSSPDQLKDVNMNDEKMEVDESARNIEFRKSVEASENKGIQKRDLSSEDESVKKIEVDTINKDVNEDKDHLGVEQKINKQDKGAGGKSRMLRSTLQRKSEKNSLKNYGIPEDEIVPDPPKIHYEQIKKAKKEKKEAKKKQNKIVKALSLRTKKSKKDKNSDTIKSQAQINEEIRLQALKTKLMIRKLLDNYIVVIFFTLITIYALFFDDIRILAVDQKFDDIFSGITLAGIILFTIEILVASYAKPEYPWSFFFYLDIISTITMIPDCEWIWYLIVEDGGNQSATDLAKTSRAGRVTRVIRVIRLIRLIRIVKLYKQAKAAQAKQAEFGGRKNKSMLKGLEIKNPTEIEKDGAKKKDIHGRYFPGYDSDSDFYHEDLKLSSSESDSDSDSSSDGEIEIPEESKISRTLGDNTTRTVVILVLSLLIMQSACSVDTYIDVVHVHKQALFQVGTIYESGAQNWEAYGVAHEFYIKETQKRSDGKFPLIYFQSVDPSGTEYGDTIIEQEWAPFKKDLRKPEKKQVTYETESGLKFIAIYSVKHQVQLDSIINISRTFFIVIILSFSSHLFTKDAQVLVLDPLERMIEKVKIISQNPMSASTDEVNYAGVYSFANTQDEKMDQRKSMKFSKLTDKQKIKAQAEELALQLKMKEEEQYETKILEKAIVKIGYLLALGFGEAGASIIGQNMTGGGDLDPMMPGARTYCIFGFCILDKFVECTEVLQGDIMTYVNRVAEITHSMVDRYGGSANKNIGDAFLLVWKFHDTDEIAMMDEIGTYNNEELCLQNKVIADVSVFSFLKIIAKLNSYNHILEYSTRDDMKVIDPNFKCKMGFGLHQGWAIEGAIGSYFKIDASYLSPNVNMAARLEAATAQFGTLLLISGSLRDILSNEMQDICREIDTVTVKGSIKPMRLFTIDIDVDNLIEQNDPMGDKDISVKKKLRDGMRAKMFSSFYKGEITTFQEFSKDRDFIDLRLNTSQEFEDDFAKYYKAYLAGDWQTAGKGFQELTNERPKDGPVKNLHEIINIDYGGAAPEWWQGFRPLTRK